MARAFELEYIQDATDDEIWIQQDVGDRKIDDTRYWKQYCKLDHPNTRWIMRCGEHDDRRDG